MTTEDAADRIRRLERRLGRERQARLELEQIAEDGMRALWEANVELDTRVAERTLELERALAAERAAKEAATAILGRLGHQLRSPLHGIGAMLELVDDEGLDPATRAELAAVRTASRRLAVTLNALLEIAGAVTTRSIDEERELRWVVADIEARWQRPAAERGLLLAVEAADPAATVTGPWRVALAITDLLVEAAVRSGAAGLLAVQVSGDRGVVLAVEQGGAVEDDVLELARLITEAYEGTVGWSGDDLVGAIVVTLPAETPPGLSSNPEPGLTSP
jgi:signal transduction histidine kinase